MNRLRVLMDVDDVLADFKGRYVYIASKLSGETYDAENITGWNIDECLGFPKWLTAEVEYYLARPDAANDIPVVPGAVETVRHLSELADVVFVTAPLKISKTWPHDRVEWLVRHFGPLGERVIHTHHKECVYGDVLVDDKPENVVLWSKHHPGGLPVLWDQPSNRYFTAEAPIVRVHSWDGLILMVMRHLVIFNAKQPG